MKKNKIIIAYILIFLSSTAAISFFSYLKVKERLTALESSISALNKEIPKLKEGLVTAKSALEESRTAIDEIPKLKASISGIGEETVQLRDQLFTTGVPVSECGLDYYAQGGIVVDGIAYFTANWTDRARGDRYRKGRYFPYVVSFDLKTFKKLRTYDFQDTYDSSPFIVHKKDGTALIIAHEYLKQRTKAININTGNTEWLSELNQAGEYFFGYSYFLRKDGTIIILCPSQKGLHALSAEDGKELWHIQESTQGAITPCVDQKNELVYYQCDGKIIKLDANSGEVLIDKDVPWPNQCISWNTVLIDDANGYYIATYWYGKPEWDSAIRVFDKDLNLVWERKSLPVGKKPTLTYADGKIVTGTGNGGYSEQYFGDKWKYIEAYSIKDGAVIWHCDLSKYGFQSICNVPYFNGYFYAETQDSGGITSKLFRIKATDGVLESVLDYGRPISSCAPSIIAHGMMLSGDISADRIVVTRLADNSKTDWVGPFGNPQKNHNSSPLEPNVTNVTMEEVVVKKIEYPLASKGVLPADSLKESL